MNNSGNYRWFKTGFFLSYGLIFFVAVCSVLGLFIPPDRVVFFAFFSISYPIILPVFIFTSLLFFFIKRKFFFLTLVLSILYSMFIPRFFQLRFYKSKFAEEKVIKVMSYNVKLFDLYNWSRNVETRNQIFSFLEKETPDIACFQEFYHQDSSLTFPTKDTLLTFMPWKYYHEKYTHEMKHKQYFGIATFSRFPIVNKGEIYFDNDDNNFCIFSDIKIDEKIVRVYNAHIGSIRFRKEEYAFFGDEGSMHQESQEGRRIFSRLKEAFVKRSYQISTIMESVARSPYPVILCIDMNDAPMSYAYQTIYGTLQDAFRISGSGLGTTYIGEVPSFRIDYIFHSSELKSGGFITHEEEYSDHRAISCQIALQ